MKANEEKLIHETMQRLETVENYRYATPPILVIIDWQELARVARLLLTPRSLADYHEDLGPVLWWKFPISEPPWCGSPLDADWPGDHTHWTPIVCPKEPTT